MKQNTTLIGDAFENKVFSILENRLKNDDLYVPGKNSIITQKKTYYSKDREDDIKFDIVIETYIEGIKKPSLITLIECKDINGPLSVDNIEEFITKKNQVGAHKGILIISERTKPQSGIINVAKNNNIGLGIIRDDELNWELARKEKKIDILNKQYLSNLEDILINTGIFDYKQEQISKNMIVPYKKEEEIVEIVDRLKKYMIYDGSCLSIEKLIGVLKEKYQGLDILSTDELGLGILGKIDIEKGLIYIDKGLLMEKNRYRYTLAHEIGHLVLHRNLLLRQKSIHLDSESSIIQAINKESIKRLEFQANLFANHLLMPDDFVKEIVKEYLKDKNIRENYIFVDNQPCNQSLKMGLIDRLCYRFGVSSEAARIKLEKLDYLRNQYTFNLF